MIVTEIFYGVKCNRCGEMFDDGEHSFWSDESSAEENAMNSEWHDLNNKHYCPNCFDYDEANDKNIVRDEYPQHLKELNKFLKTVSGYSLKNIEYDDFFIVSKSLSNRNSLMPFEEEYIKGLLGENLLNIEYKKHERYNQNECIVKVKKQP